MAFHNLIFCTSVAPETTRTPDAARLFGNHRGTCWRKNTSFHQSQHFPKTKKALIYKAFSLVGLVGLEPMSTIRNRVLSSLPLAITLCSLGLRLALSPTGCARLRPPHDREDHRFSALQTAQKNHPQGVVFTGGISRTRTYDPHDVNVVL